MTASRDRSGGWLARAFGALLLVVGTHAAAAECKLSQLEIPVRMVNQRPVGTLTLNGTEVPLLIDSGAFHSFLSPAAAEELGLRLRYLPPNFRIEGYTGRVEARMTRVERVGLRGHELRNVDFVVGGNELGSGIKGILGRNFLSIADTEYDLAHGVVRITFPKGDCRDTNLAYWAGEAPIVVTELERSDRNNATDVRTEVRINGKSMVALLDTGAPFTSLSLRSAKRAGLRESDLKEMGRTSGAGEGSARSWTGAFDSFELGGEKILKQTLRVADVDHNEHDLLLGLDYFLSHRIYVSRLQRKLYVTWNGGPVFERGGATGHYDQRYAARPVDLPTDDAEALARRGEASAARGELAKALADLDRACELAPDSAANLLARARVHMAMRNNVKARQDLDRALELQPALHDALGLRATLRISGRQRDAAIADLAALDAALPPSSHLREAMGRDYASLNLPTEALRQWELWVSTHKSDARRGTVLYHRCWLRMRLNIELKEALDDCKSAVGVDRADPSFREGLGWVQLRLGDAESAVEAFDAALKLQSRAYALYGRALARQRLGQQGDAADLAAARRLDAAIDAKARRSGLPVAADAPPPPAPATPAASAASAPG